MLTRRVFCGGAGASLLGAAGERPNVVMILADDLGWGDLGCYNRASKVRTPNLDRLADQGVRFTDMHSGSAVCTPTRYGLLTGRYCWRGRLKSGVLNGYSPNLIEPGRTTLASMLRAQGYYTAGVGKWHLGLGERDKTDFDEELRPGPREHGFDYYFGIPASLDMPPYLYFENGRVVEKASGVTPGSGDKARARGPFWREGPIAPHFDIGEVMPELTRRAVGVVKERARERKPFFLYFPMTGPHTPWVPAKAFQGKSGAGAYGDFVAQIDDSVAQVLRAVDAAGAGKDTLVIFASDNGAYWAPDQIEQYGHRANDGWRGMKADVFDGGHRVPFIARWPGRIGRGTVCGELGCLTDVMATVAEACSVGLPRDCAEDSFSQWGAMTGRWGAARREFVIHHSSQGMFAIREKRWKLIEGRGSGGFTKPVKEEGAGELFDMERDPGETRSMWAEEAETVVRLRGMLARAREAGRTRD